MWKRLWLWRIYLFIESYNNDDKANLDTGYRNQDRQMAADVTKTGKELDFHVYSLLQGSYICQDGSKRSKARVRKRNGVKQETFVIIIILTKWSSTHAAQARR